MRSGGENGCWAAGRPSSCCAATCANGTLDAPLAALVIGRESGGAPVAVLDEWAALAAGWQPTGLEELPLIAEAGERPDGPPLTVRGVRLPVSLSISHSNGAAFCALLATDRATVRWQLGADIERIAPRSDQFRASFLTEAENRWIGRAVSGAGSVRDRPEHKMGAGSVGDRPEHKISAGSVGDRPERDWTESRPEHEWIEDRPEREAELCDMLVTATWSAKESVLKALQLGLTVDTRRVTVLCQIAGDLTQWTPVQIDCDSAILPHPDGADGVSTAASHRLDGWWRVEGDYVLTMALLEISLGR
ncbi:MAG: 4'-phosphopantetheinyl transferase superfamily protein [Caldilineales bacterium]